ncbi:BnaA09g35070D [Brassica napus]|uniref:BnaA09g35070D protein n=1 Tax=Brassica napus TaxID=3708 RepID=A0A078HNU3_BRANA|nr:BnaA09g35070D [Brassica napus]
MDRISGLSDELLVKILLLVPTKVAVSTSILSKRWEYLWMWLPKLDYVSGSATDYGHSYCSEPESSRLRRFLDHNLPLHRAPVIESFRLELLNILPSNLFTCKSLVILKLAGGMLLNVPRMVSLPSLKTLKLQRVKYFKGKTLQRLLSNCPVLEDLVLDLPKGESTGKLTVVVPSLQRLSLDIPSAHDIVGYVIKTPDLKYFKLVDDNDKSHYCLIEHMPNLSEAHLDVALPDIKSIIGSITSVRRLAICSAAMFDEGFVLNQLEHLKVCVCRDHSSNQIFRLLKSSTILQELNLFSMEDHFPQFMDNWNEPSTVPECLLSSLQSLNWSLYGGEPQERDIVIYILEHAVHLKTATIESSEGQFSKFEMLQELALSSRASTTCKLMFECPFEL